MSSRRNKFGAIPTEVDGHRFPSKREANRYCALKRLQISGDISELELQPKFPLMIDGKFVLMRSDRYPNGRRCSYTADFRYRVNGAVVVEEVKGGRATDTEASRLRRAVAEAQYDMRVRLV